MRVAVLGRGAWGQALGGLLSGSGHEVSFYGKGDRIEWPGSIELVVLAVPSRFLGAVLATAASPGCDVVSGVKGIEPETLRRPSELVRGAWGDVPFAVLSGPSFAEEVRDAKPTAVVVASEASSVARRVQDIFHRTTFRVYRSEDVAGVELGGALKNVYAIAAGISFGLGFGHNTMAALVSRALAEMARVGVVLGGRPETFMGLSGVGDLMLTCYGALSRNRRYGLALAQGVPREEIAPGIGGVAEGVTTVRALRRIAERSGVSAPLIDSIDQVIYLGMEPECAVRELLARAAKPEN